MYNNIISNVYKGPKLKIFQEMATFQIGKDNLIKIGIFTLILLAA